MARVCLTRVRILNMARMRKKSEMPCKICAACARPFTWRRKWARDWAEVKCCSDRCQRSRKPG
ncbi:DUF2256 domain-containing protein [Novosphingobium sp. 11B]